MECSPFKSILERLLSHPLGRQIRIDFCLEKKVFQFSMPIFTADKTLPSAVKEYVAARKGKSFRPYATSFSLDEERIVCLTQEIPFDARGVERETFRKQVQSFCELAEKCHKMLMEIGVEDAFHALFSENIHRSY